MDRRLAQAVLIGVVALCMVTAGCVSFNITMPSSGPTNTTPPPVDATPAVTGTLPASLVPSPVPTTGPVFSKSQVIQHFEDIVFGNSGTVLKRWDKPVIKVGIAGDYTREDIDTLNNFIMQFNNVSATAKITPVYESENQELTIRYVPPSYFRAVDESSTNLISRSPDGRINFVDQTNNLTWSPKNTVYLDSEITGDRREYWLLRGLLFDLGFQGTAGNPDSFFYYAPVTTNLTDMDWAAINMMYSRKFSAGDDLNSVRSILL